jgi:hypothetical protein
MMRTNNDFALKTAIELAKVNIESTQEWVNPEEVNYFIEEVYNLLTGEKKTDE